MDQSRKRRWLRVPSPAMIVACVALFVAMGGTSYAAVTLAANSVGTKQIKNSAVTAAKIKNGAVTTTKVGRLPGARVRDTVLTLVDSNATAVLSYNAIDFNVGAVFDPAKPTRMTAPVAGRYLIVATTRWESDVDGRRTIALEVNGNAAQIARSNVSGYWQGGVVPLSPEQSVQAVYRLKAGDYVEVWAYQDTGSTLNLITAVDNGVTFTMQWIAP
jgi:hypothetical protein